jgi:pyroglutamyl-peptidase
MNVLVTGFGAFPGVPRNPSGDLARAVDGADLEGVRVVGRVLEVSYSRGPREAISLARSLEAAIVIGTGVASKRSHVDVERRAVRAASGPADVDGRKRSGLRGPSIVEATIDVDRLAHALAANVSDDAGRYVCNAWLYRVTRGCAAPVGFVHVPPAGLDPALLLAGLRALLAARYGGAGPSAPAIAPSTSVSSSPR